MVKNDDGNYDLENVIIVTNAGCDRIKKKTAAMIAQMEKDQEILLKKIDRLQSGDLRSGLLDDDGDDLLTLVDELEESGMVNLEQIENSFNSYALTAAAALAGAGFLRVDKKE